MARTGRPRGKTYDDYLPQTACTHGMFEEIRQAADRDYRGSIGAYLRAAAQEKLDREKPRDPLQWDK